MDETKGKKPCTCGATGKAVANLCFLVVTIAVNALGAFGIINGLSQKQVSDMYPTLITPSPFTFQIWMVIYALLIVSMIVMIVKSKDKYWNKAIENISWMFWVSCIFNIAWIVAFSYVKIWLSVLFIAILMITLGLICSELLRMRKNGKWLLPLTFGIYFGWIVVATVVNISAFLVKLNWNGFGLSSYVWTVIVLAFAVILTAIITCSDKNAAIPLPVAWAFFGIHQANKLDKMVNISSIIGILLLLGLAVYTLILNGWAILPKDDSNGSKNLNDSKFQV